ncbi:MAG: tRNA dihydrouridine synthase [Thermoguttaceae bacterium]
MQAPFTPLNIGPITVPYPVIQAALSGYSDPPMRKIAKKLGAPFTLCEVLLDQFVLSVSKGRKAKLYIKVEEEDHPCGAQIMGNEPDMYVQSALKLVQCGFDLIDLNFACPVKKVLGRLRGGHFLRDPKSALEIVAKVRDALPPSIPLTVKLRKGFDESEESRERFYELLNGAIARGVCGITLHGRTVRQRYEGESDWAFVREVKQHLLQKGHKDIPLIGSGDLLSPEIAVLRLKESGIDGIALARGAIGNPWIFREVLAVLDGQPVPAPPDLQEQRKILQEHYERAEDFYGLKRSGPMMRGFGVRYARLHPFAEQVRDEFIQVKTKEQWTNLLEKWYK